MSADLIDLDERRRVLRPTPPPPAPVYAPMSANRALLLALVEALDKDRRPVDWIATAMRAQLRGAPIGSETQAALNTIELVLDQRVTRLLEERYAKRKRRRTSPSASADARSKGERHADGLGD